MIQRIRHRGLRALYQKDDADGISPDWVPRVRRILTLLDAASDQSGMDVPGFRLHALKGGYAGHWSTRVTGSWRIVWRFEDGDATDVDLIDYH